MDTYSFDDHQVRVVDRDGNPWFIALDVCRVLELKNVSATVQRLDADEKGTIGLIDSAGRARTKLLVSHPGVVILTMSSRSERAKAFKRWLAHEVMEDIRKTGSYSPQKSLDLGSPKQLTQLALQLTEKVQEYQAELAQAKPKVDFYDRVAQAKGELGLQATAKLLSLKPNTWIKRLRTQGYLHTLGGVATPKQRYLDQGLFVVRERMVGETMRAQTYVTTKGQQYFAKKHPVRTL